MNAIRLVPACVEKAWGGDALQRLFGPAPGAGDESAIGERWVLSAHPHGMSRAEDGRPLCDIAPERPFPLLVKFLDARETLSVQVHPDDERDSEGRIRVFGKTEAWVVLRAEVGAKLYCGLRPGWSQEALRAAAEEGRLQEALVAHSVRAGDVFFIPAGLVHAIGAGIQLYEIQENSDTTYRLYDWNRRDAEGRQRALHLDAALEATKPQLLSAALSGIAAPLPQGTRRLYIACTAFALERWRWQGRCALPAPGCFQALSCVAGACMLCSCEGELSLKAGETAYVPAGLSGLTLEGDAELLRGWVPDRAALKREWKALGATEEDWQQLAGVRGEETL